MPQQEGNWAMRQSCMSGMPSPTSWVPGHRDSSSWRPCLTAEGARGGRAPLRPHTWGQRARSRAWIATRGCWPLPVHSHPRLARPSRGSRGVRWPWISQTRRLTSLTRSARGVFLKKRKWVTYSGQAFFNWHTGKITIPPGVQVHSQPMEADLLIWEDYQGEIPLLEDPTDKKLLRAVFVLTQFFDQSLPVPDLELLSTGERTDGRKPEISDTNVFDPNAVYVGKAVEEAGRTKRCT